MFGFPVWTFGVIAGAIWADQAWGRYWGWDPVETWALITGVLYAAFLHARSTAGWRGRRAHYIQLLGFGSLAFNILVVQTVIPGMHSYAGGSLPEGRAGSPPPPHAGSPGRGRARRAGPGPRRPLAGRPGRL